MKKKFQLQGLVGESQSFLQVIEKIPPLAQSGVTVLISGETGTGKELIARAIHYGSPRQGKPFIPLNCGGLPDQLFENELFGHVKGAYTGASSAERGLVAEAEGGTLFLDEVGTLSASAQVKLLRFMQDREYRPLGSSTSRTADVRIIAATNVDLWQQVQAKAFREDLYYRLVVLVIWLPPLRERTEDIPLLANHFLTLYGRHYGRASPGLSPGAHQKLLAYHWPGNVRELEGVMQRVLILKSSAVIQPEDIDLAAPYQSELSEGGSLRDAKTRATVLFERAYVTKLLAVHQGNVSQAAKDAGKDRRSFQRLIKKYRLDRNGFRNQV